MITTGIINSVAPRSPARTGETRVRWAPGATSNPRFATLASIPLGPCSYLVVAELPLSALRAVEQQLLFGTVVDPVNAPSSVIDGGPHEPALLAPDRVSRSARPPTAGQGNAVRDPSLVADAAVSQWHPCPHDAPWSRGVSSADVPVSVCSASALRVALARARRTRHHGRDIVATKRGLPKRTPFLGSDIQSGALSAGVNSSVKARTS